MVWPDSWGRISPVLWDVRYYLCHQRGNPVDTSSTPSLRFFPRYLRSTAPGMALSGESVAIGNEYSAGNLRLLTWVGRAMRGEPLGHCVLCTAGPAISVGTVPHTAIRADGLACHASCAGPMDWVCTLGRHSSQGAACEPLDGFAVPNCYIRPRPLQWSEVCLPVLRHGGGHLRCTCVWTRGRGGWPILHRHFEVGGINSSELCL